MKNLTINPATVAMILLGAVAAIGIVLFTINYFTHFGHLNSL